PGLEPRRARRGRAERRGDPAAAARPRDARCLGTPGGGGAPPAAGAVPARKQRLLFLHAGRGDERRRVPERPLRPDRLRAAARSAQRLLQRQEPPDRSVPPARRAGSCERRRNPRRERHGARGLVSRRPLGAAARAGLGAAAPLPAALPEPRRCNVRDARLLVRRDGRRPPGPGADRPARGLAPLAARPVPPGGGGGMSAATFQALFARLVIDPTFRDDVRAQGATALDGDLTALERERLLFVSADPGMDVTRTLHK